jgi:hypothetical protein
VCTVRGSRTARIPSDHGSVILKTLFPTSINLPFASLLSQTLGHRLPSDARIFSTSRCSKDGNKVTSMTFFSAHKGASFGALCYAVDGQYACTKRGWDLFISVLLSMDRPRPWLKDPLRPLQRTRKGQDWSAHLIRPFRRNEGAVLTAASPPRGCI